MYRYSPPKEQAENILSSCSFLILKTLFHFILYVFQYHILKATTLSIPYCVLIRRVAGKLKPYIMHSQEADLFIKSNYNTFKCKTSQSIDLFSLHIEPPSYWHVPTTEM